MNDIQPRATNPLILDIVSDVVCPWCYIHFRRLEQARQSMADVPLAVRWRPYQLDPTIPSEGVDRKQYMLKKFGDSDRVAQLNAAVTQEGESAGITFAFEKIAKSPNTLDAHRLIHWAGTQDILIQHRLVERLFQLFFEEGGDLSDHETLASAGAEVGLEKAVLLQLLESDADADMVKEEIAQANEMGVQGVPFTLIEQRYGLPGAQPPDVLVNALQQVAEAKSQGQF